MPQWGTTDNANSAPVGPVIASAKGIYSGKVAYANTTPNAFVDLGTVGVSLVTATNVANTAKGYSHPGWTVQRAFTGPVDSIKPAGGTGYANTDTVTVTGGTANAVGVVTTDGAGVPLKVTLREPGAGFYNIAQTSISVASSGTGATFTVALGGRAGRTQTETLVALAGV